MLSVVVSRAMTPKETAEHRLWFGKKYASLPEGYGEHCEHEPAGAPLSKTPVTREELEADANRQTYPYAGEDAPSPGDPTRVWHGLTKRPVRCFWGGGNVSHLTL